MVNLRPAEDVKAEREAKASGIEPMKLTPIAYDWIDADRRPDPASFLVDREGESAFPIGKVSLLAAKGGMGKTTLSAQLAIAVATGKPWIGFNVRFPGPVLWLLGEEDKATARRLVWHAAQAAPLKADDRERLLANLHVETYAGSGVDLALRNDNGPSDFAARIANALSARKPERGPWSLVIVDPLSRFSHAEDENDNAAATKVIESLETLAKASGAAVLACHHSGKGQKVGDDAIRGASALLDGARFGMTLARESDEPSNARTLQCVKSNYGPAWWKVPLTFDVGGKVFAPGSSGATANEAKKSDARPAPRGRSDAG